MNKFNLELTEKELYFLHESILISLDLVGDMVDLCDETNVNLSETEVSKDMGVLRNINRKLNDLVFTNANITI